MSDMNPMGAPGAAMTPGAMYSPGMALSPGMAEPQAIGAGFAASPALMDVGKLSRQAQAQMAFERVSALPPMPVSVRLSLLASPLIPDEQAMNSFQYGLERDILDAQSRARQQVEAARSTSTTPDTGLSNDYTLRAADNIGNEFRRILHGVVGGNLFNPPSAIPGDANSPVIQAKLDAIEQGFLPPDTPLDGKWDPAFNNAFYESRSAQLGDALAGNQPGKMSGGQILDAIDNWASPSSLLSAAGATIFGDLIPNFGNIAEETKGWGGKIGAFFSGEDFSFSGLVAALGPIDDIAFPLLNTAMLFSGVGSIAGFARVGFTASKAYGGLRTVDNLADFGRAVTVANDAGRFALGGMNASRALDIGQGLFRAQQPGLLSQAAGRVATRASSGLVTGAAEAAAGGMAAWRANLGVQVGRKVVGEGMKLGFAAQLEASISPDRKVGMNPFGTPEQTHAMRIEEFKNWRTTNPIAATVAGVFEVGFTPMNVVKPGTFSRPVMEGIEISANVPVIGGFKIPGFSDVPSRLRNQNVLTVGAGEAADAAAQITKDLDNELRRLGDVGVVPRHGGRVNSTTMNSFDDAVDRVAYFFTGDADGLRGVRGAAGRAEALEKANDQAFYLATTSAIDHVAWSQADSFAPAATAGEEANRAAFLTIRGQIEARVRDLGDLADFDPEDYAKVQSLFVYSNGMGRNRDWLDPANTNPARLLQEDVDAWRDALLESPEMAANVAREVGRHHQELRAASMNDLLSYLTPDILGASINKQMDTFGSWDDWLASVDEAEMAFRARGTEISITGITEDMEAGARPWAESFAGSDVARILPTLTPDQVKSSAIDRAATMIDSGNFALTPGGVHTATRQEANALVVALEDMTRTRSRVQSLVDVEGEGSFGMAVESLREWAAREGIPMDKLARSQVEDWARASGTWAADAADSKKIDAYRKARSEAGLAIQWLMKQGYDLADAPSVLQRNLDAINDASFWSKMQVPLQRNHTRNTGLAGAKIEMGFEPTSIEEKINKLKNVKDFLGTEVDVPLSNGRYRTVMGNAFLQQRDLKGGLGILADIKDKHIRRMALGTFLTRQEDSVVNGLRTVRFRQAMSGRLMEFFDWDEDLARFVPNANWDGPLDFDPMPGSASMDQLIGNLGGVHRAHAEVAMAQEEYSRGLFSQVGARIANNAKSFNAYEIEPTTLARWLSAEELPENVRYGQRALDAVIGASRESRSIGFEYRGLAQLGDRMAAEGWTRQAFGGLRYSRASDDLGQAAKWARVAGVGPHSNEVDIYRHWKAAGLGLAVGLFQGVDATLEGDSLGEIAMRSAGGAVAGTAIGAASSRIDGAGGIMRTGVRAGLAMAGNEAAGGGLEGAITGGLAGTFGMAGIRAFATKRHNTMLAEGVQQYSRLGERFERLRNAARFALSPIFDIQRYTEGVVLSGATIYTDKDGVRRQLPLALKPLDRAVEDLKDAGGDFAHLAGMTDRQAAAEIQSMFDASARGQEWADALTMVDARVSERGIMGFSPYEAISGTWAQLVANGVDPQEAVGISKSIYTYGSKARSGFEQSANFIFFPFSFQKQYVQRLGRFFNEDLGRLMVVHNSLKALEQLEETTQFGEFVEKRIPYLDQLRKINALAYGLSPGQFGGINRPYVDALRTVGFGVNQGVDSVINAFLPNGIEVNTKADADAFTRQLDRLLPVFRDGRDLWEDTVEFGYVASSPAHQTKEWDRQDGWTKFGELKEEFEAVAKSIGVSYQTLRRDPRYAPYQAEFTRRERALEQQHPAWRGSRSDSVKFTAERASDLRMIRLAPNQNDPSELAIGVFYDSVEQTRSLYGDLDVVDLPVQVQAQLRRKAQLLAVEAPGFLRQYQRFYQRDLGPIEMRL